MGSTGRKSLLIGVFVLLLGLVVYLVVDAGRDSGNGVGGAPGGPPTKFKNIKPH